MKKIAIMQPYFFPYIGYWQLIANTDLWVFFDVVQYNKRSWMNRNRILHPNETLETQYITVPIKKHERGTLIKDVEINNTLKWKDEILGKLTVYKNLKAPYYDHTAELVTHILNKQFKTFLELSIHITTEICKYLSIDFDYRIASEIDFKRSDIHAPGDWALNITKALSGKKYINPHSGKDIFDPKKYETNGIELFFLKPKLVIYKQGYANKFVESLSIIDLLMFNEKNEITRVLNQDFELYS